MTVRETDTLREGVGEGERERASFRISRWYQKMRQGFYFRPFYGANCGRVEEK